MTIVPRDTVVIVGGDEHLSALWYCRYIIAGDFSRVSIVSPALLQSDGYDGESCRRLAGVCSARQADLQTSPRVRLEQIVNGSLTCRRTVHTIDDGEWLANYAFQQTGNLYWIRSR